MSISLTKVLPVRSLSLLGWLVLTLQFACSKNISVEENEPSATDAGDSDAGLTPDQVPDSTLAISGSVLDADTGDPLQAALVSLSPGMGQVTTDSLGQYLFLADGPDVEFTTQEVYRVTASKAGYKQNFVQLLVKAGHNRNVDILLEQQIEVYRVLLDRTTLQFVADDPRRADTRPRGWS